jgi:hypothetical protein
VGFRMETNVGYSSMVHPWLLYLGRMDEYEDRWRELKRRRNQLLFAFIGYVPITLAFGVLTERLFHSDKPGFVFAILWMLYFGVAGFRYNVFPCPRCGKWFFGTWFYHNSFARRCVHCKLPIYSTTEHAAAQDCAGHVQ